MTDSFFGIDKRILNLSALAQSECAEQFALIEETSEYNGQKVLAAFIKNRVSESCLKGTTGYG